MKQTYEAWETDSGSAFFEVTRRTANEANPAVSLIRLLFKVQADSWEEAMSIYHLRMGWEPYRPEGAAQPCPDCAALYYPEGSGQCWNCGKVDQV